MPFIIQGIALVMLSGTERKLLAASFETYWLLAKIIIGIVAITALAKIVLNNLSFGSYAGIKTIFTDTIKFIVILAFMPTVTQTAIDFTDHMAEQIRNAPEIRSVADQAERQLDQEWYPYRWGQKFGEYVKVVAQGLASFIGQAIDYLHCMLLAILISMAPIFLYCGFMLGLKWFTQAVLGLGITVLLWPVMAATLVRFSIIVFDARADGAWTDLSQAWGLIIVAIAQLMIPLSAIFSFLRSASTVSSGVGQIGGAAINTAKWGHSVYGTIKESVSK